MNVEFEVILECNAPIIHFQYDKAGATLRATEVKPKLDRFLKKKKADIPPDWYARSSDKQEKALDYKMRIEAIGEQTYTEPNYNNLYYWNSGNGPKKYAVLGNCRLSIVCFKSKLLDFIRDNITEFFVVTNFGAMQNKGFGSYIPQNISEAEKSKIPSWLKESAGADACYKIGEYRQGNKMVRINGEKKNIYAPAYEFMFDDIKTLYCVMKSGYNIFSYKRSYLFEFFHKRDMGNEKALMKKRDISPNIMKSTNREKVHPVESGEYKYVRALLGIGGFMEYIKKLDNNDRPAKEKDKMGRDRVVKERIVIKDVKALSKDERIKKEAIERLSSPVFFKIIGNNIYVTAKRIDNRVYGSKFVFENTSYQDKRIEIEVPRKEEFEMTENGVKYSGIDGFLKWFFEQYSKVGKRERFRIQKDIKVV